MKTFIYLITLIALMATFSSNNSAQAMCVIAEQKVGILKGIVTFDDGETRIQGANLKLTNKIDEKVVIKEIQTNEKGRFEIKDVRKGKYVLVVSNPQAVTLYIPIKLIRNNNSKYLHIRLGSFIGESCGGGDVEIREKSLD